MSGDCRAVENQSPYTGASPDCWQYAGILIDSQSQNKLNSGGCYAPKSVIANVKEDVHDVKMYMM